MMFLLSPIMNSGRLGSRRWLAAGNSWSRTAGGLLIASLLVVMTVSGLAWWKVGVSDADLVSRAEIIAVAHIKPGSVEYVKVSDGSFDHRAVLVLTEVLKGKPAAKEIPILIRYGLTVDFPGNTNRSKSGFGWWMSSNGKTQHIEAPAPNTIQVHDFNPGTWPRTYLVVTDATEDRLWFLHRQVHADPAVDPKAPLGVKDGQDMQPIALKEYFMAYLAAQPEAAVSKVVEQQPALAHRTRDYLAAFEIQRALAEPDAKLRLEKLLPHFLSNPYHGGVKSGLVTCGPEAVVKLRSLFTDAQHEGNVRLRVNIMGIWGEQRDRDSVPLLIALLEKHEKFWSEQKLYDGWWNHGFNSPLTQQRRNLYSEVNAAVRALGGINDPRAKAALELTRTGWEKRDLNGNSQILEGSVAALKALERSKE